MKVTVVFDFPTVHDPDCQLADEIVSDLTMESAVWQRECSAFYMVECRAYVDEVEGEHLVSDEARSNGPHQSMEI